MAQAARPTTAVTVSRLPPATYKGTAQSWRVLTEAIWPGARSQESIMLALAYCGQRGLDPFKRPVHIVPVYNSALRREVETVWPGISELLTVASRSKQFAGVDEPREGPQETRTFEGTDREGKPVSKTITFPAWASITVYRMVEGVRVAFSSPVYWLEAYARQSFRSEVPNDMWAKRPHGQLHKCALAAALRLGFPEDIGSDYAAEEMEGREVAGGGVTIEHDDPTGLSSTPPPPTYDASPPADREAARERLSEAYEDPATPTAVERLAAEPDGRRWLLLLEVLATTADSLDALGAIASSESVGAALRTAPSLIRDQINDVLKRAHDRLVPPAPPPADGPMDPLADILAAIEAMDLMTIAGLAESAEWRLRVKDLFPSDMDRVEEAVAERRTTLTKDSGP